MVEVYPQAHAQTKETRHVSLEELQLSKQFSQLEYVLQRFQRAKSKDTVKYGAYSNSESQEAGSASDHQ